MKVNENVSSLCCDLAALKESLRVFNECGGSFLANINKVANDPDVRAAKLGPNEFASVRFKAMQALTLVEQAHAVLAECDLEIVDVATKKQVRLSVEGTDLTI